jgi:hypothetical protein
MLPFIANIRWQIIDVFSFHRFFSLSLLSVGISLFVLAFFFGFFLTGNNPIDADIIILKKEGRAGNSSEIATIKETTNVFSE